MYCSSTPTPKDFLIKIEKSDRTEDCNVNHDDNQNKSSTQSVGLFRKYLFPKAQNNIGDSKEDERARVIKRTSCTLYPELAHNSRPRSCLEKRMFSEMQSDVMLAPSPPALCGKATTSQLAIFYAGIVNVYENISTDQAHAIMHLARSSKSAPIVANTQKVDVPKSQHDQRLSLSSLCKLQAADLPLARRNSLRRFMDKRRGRITSKSPYTAAASSCSSQYVEDDHCGSNGEESLSHSSSLEFIDLSYKV